MAIPRILHQIYLKGWDSLPEETKESIRALRARNPGWEYRFYDAETAEAYIGEKFGSDVLRLYRRIDPAYYAARSDFLRYLVCYEAGGVYLDIKSSALRPLDEVLLADDEFLLSQWPGQRDLPLGRGWHRELLHVQGDEFAQWFVASAPGHPFLAAVLDATKDNISRYRFWKDDVGRRAVWRATGPIAYTLAIFPILAQHRHKFVKYESDLGFVYSIHDNDSVHRSRYGQHYWTLSRPLIETSRFETSMCEFWMGWARWKLHAAGKRLGLVREKPRGQ